MNKESKGITLIALIITIVIMIILLGVIITGVINGGLFNATGRAVGETNNKVAQQQDRVDELMGVLEEVEWKGHDFRYTDNTLERLKCTCSMCKRENEEGRIYSIGQQIKKEENDILIEDASTATGREWIIFGAEDKDKNGTNETLLITTLKPSEEELELEGADAYNNGIAKIEAKVKEIYGNEARAMTIEDVNRTLGYTPAGGMYIDANGTYGTTGNFTTKLKELSIWEIIKAEGTKTPDGANTETALGEYPLDGYGYSIDKEKHIPYVPETTSNMVKNVVFGAQSDKSQYWLASRGVWTNSYYAYFGPGSVYGGFAYSNCGLFNSYGNSYSDLFAVRPVISLRSDIPAVGNILVSNAAWTV